MIISRAVMKVKQLLAGTILSPEMYFVLPMIPAPFFIFGRGLSFGFLAECSEIPYD